MTLDKNYIKDTLKKIGQKYGVRETFEDFVYCCAYSLSNLTNFNDSREKEYLNISKKYEKEDFNSFASMLSALILELNKDDCEDILGNVFEELGLHDKGRGQFFTPLHISKFMAEIVFDKENIQNEISNLCCCMTYVSLSLMGASAIINHQNTLSSERYGYYITPGLILNENLVNNLIKDGYLKPTKENDVNQENDIKNLEEEQELEI